MQKTRPLVYSLRLRYMMTNFLPVLMPHPLTGLLIVLHHLFELRLNFLLRNPDAFAFGNWPLLDAPFFISCEYFRIYLAYN